MTRTVKRFGKITGLQEKTPDLRQWCVERGYLPLEVTSEESVDHRTEEKQIYSSAYAVYVGKRVAKNWLRCQTLVETKADHYHIDVSV